MMLPDSVEPQHIGAWSDAFFASNFTHLSGGKRWLRSGTYTELLSAAVAAQHFDSAWLIDAKVTVEGALCTN